MEFDGALIQPIDAGGVCSLLFAVSGYAAIERGSEIIESKDLIKAIYIVDIEHVLVYWSDWEGFERIVSNGTYINRVLYLLRVELNARDAPDGFVGLGKPSDLFQQIVAVARRLATDRSGSPVTPSSRDFLFSACLIDAELSKCLQKSGLQLHLLEAAVKKKS